ncbi:MAG: dihydrodipicolinate synthase family protein [Limnohabitans sp.]|nr:dihydrodipicolinate synthase family protein [Limnohabitans sp.]
MRLTDQVHGVYPIAPTAFLDDGTIDTSSMDRLTDFYVASGATGVTVLGQLGEAPKLSLEESVSITRAMTKRASGLPIIAGVSSPGFASMRILAQEVMAAGAAGVMIAPPNTLRTDDQIVTYYQQASDAIGTDIPIVLQDYPLTFTVQMTPGVIRRMVKEIPAIVMLKHEDWPGLEKITALRNFEKNGEMRHIAILCGNGGLFLDYEMSRGADGANTGYAFPDMLCDVVRLSRAGETEAAHDLFDAHLPLLRYEQQPGVGLAVRKYIMRRRGLLTSDAQRKPGAKMSAQAVKEVEHLLTRLGRKDPRARLT